MICSGHHGLLTQVRVRTYPYQSHKLEVLSVSGLAVNIKLLDLLSSLYSQCGYRKTNSYPPKERGTKIVKQHHSVGPWGWCCVQSLQAWKMMPVFCAALEAVNITWNAVIWHAGPLGYKKTGDRYCVCWAFFVVRKKRLRKLEGRGRLSEKMQE